MELNEMIFLAAAPLYTALLMRGERRDEAMKKALQGARQLWDYMIENPKSW